MPPELSKLVEEARVSEARLKLKDPKEIDAWAAEWANANLKTEQSQWRNAVLARLEQRFRPVLGRAAASWRENHRPEMGLGKEAQDWMRKEGIDEPSQKYIQAAKLVEWKGGGFTGVGKIIRRLTAEDFIYCFDARNGKLLWKTAPMKGVAQSMGAHTHSRDIGQAVLRVQFGGAALLLRRRDRQGTLA